jgi:radical SAM protein with 4Fe4S-binding SPASM domain
MYSPFRHINSIFWKKRPIHLTFFLTRRCNAKCPFCFYLKTDTNSVTQNTELSLDEIEKISGSMDSLLWLAFSGGEIYLREDLVEISRIFYRNNKPAIMLFPTNGLLPEVIKNRTGQILKQCPDSIIAVKLSMDGLYHEHDALRNTPDSFEKTMATYHLLKELLKTYPNFELGINTVFCSENQEKMDEIIDFVNTLESIKTHTISLIRGNLSDRSFKDIDYLKYSHAIERLENNLKANLSSIYRFKGAKIKAAQDILQRRLINQTMLDKKRLIPCYAGRLNLVLSENGDVYPCEILTESFGNIRDYDCNMGKVVQSDNAKKIIDSIMNRKCYCTHECYFITNILFNPALYPALAREYIQL